MIELQARGVQATKEVQQSARRVVEENVRLKALLRYVGVNDFMIETWTPDSTEQSPQELSNDERKRAARSERRDKMVGLTFLETMFAINSNRVGRLMNIARCCQHRPKPLFN